MGTQTGIDVRVIAKGGKYLGDDIGGALITVRDIHTGELLASGKTAGGSGLSNLMDIPVTQSDVLPVTDASVFSFSLDLDEPRLIRVKAFGPLAAPQSANTAVLTQWVYPGKNITGGTEGGGFLLELSGLIVDVVNPPVHFKPETAPDSIEIRAAVAMMCGCPIGVAPWNPEDFEVVAVVTETDGTTTEIKLNYDTNAPYNAPSQFSAEWQIPKNTTDQTLIYAITVYAYQQITGNTGIDKTTILIPPG
jgi:hypothetical protein